MNEQELLKLKKDIEVAKQKVSELKGENQALMKRLKEDWGCGSLKDAEEKVKKMIARVEKLSGEIESRMDLLENRLEEK